MRISLLLALLAGNAAAQVATVAPLEKTLSEAVIAFLQRTDEVKKDPCRAENEFLNHYEILFEATPRHSVTEPEGAPPASVILTMDRCDVLTEDHVERKPMTPTAERRYTEGDWGLILTTALGSDRTWVTVVAKKNGAWVSSGQMGEFKTTELFDVWDKGRADVSLAVYQWRGVKYPYSLHVSIRPSWSR